MPDLPFRTTPDGLLHISKDTLRFVDELLGRELDTRADLHYLLSVIRTENDHFVDALYEKVQGLPQSEKIPLLEGAIFTYESFKHQQRANTFLENFVGMFKY